MWRAFDETGRLAVSRLRRDGRCKLMPMYWVRAVGGSLYIAGMLLFGYNILHDLAGAPGGVRGAGRPGARRSRERRTPSPRVPPPPAGGAGALRPGRAGTAAGSGCRSLFTVMAVVAVVVASLFEIIPTFLIRSNVPTIASVKPYTPLELAGRDLYIREGCFNCHSQMIRPFRHETERYGEYSKPGEFVYDHPFLWGSRRIGPDLAREGGKYPDLWHVRHMREPARDHAEVDHAGVPAAAHQPARLRRHPDARRRDGDARRAVRRRGRATRPAHGARAGAGDRRAASRRRAARRASRTRRSSR